MLQQHFPSMLETFLDDKAHADDGGTSLTAEVDDAQSRIAVGKEIVNEQHTVVIVRYSRLTVNGYSRCLVNEWTVDW